MVLISRISRLFRADLHAVLDRIEEPELLLRHAIREMEDLQAEDEQRSRLLQQQWDHLCSRQQQLEQELSQIQEKLQVCFRADEAGLARKLIRRRLETEQMCDHLSTQRKMLEDTTSETRNRLEANRERLHNMRQKAELLITENQPQHPQDDWRMPDNRVADEDVEVAYLRERQQRSQA